MKRIIGSAGRLSGNSVRGSGWRSLMVRGLTGIAATIGLLGSVVGSGLAASPAAEPLLLVLGDSLSAAHGLSVEQGWVALLERRLNTEPAADDLHARVINASVSGETTSGGLARLPALLAEHQPDVLVIELGANDGLRGLPLQDITARLEQLIALGQQAHAQVVLLGVRLPPNYGAAYSQGFQRQFAQVARHARVRLVPRLLAGVADHRDLMQDDGLHPTAAAQPMILATVWSSLRDALLAAVQSEPSVRAEATQEATQ